MNITLDDLQAKIFEIQYLKTRLEKEVREKRKELLTMSNIFTNYYDLYIHGKAMSSSQEEFNDIMFDAREIFFKKT